MNYKVSVIVPVYNVEAYLAQCLDSLVHQSLEELEIIVVNDSTKDNSQQIIDRYQKDYPTKIFPFIKENGGVGEARNFGLKKANAEYIGFIDSDDYVELDMYEKMYTKAIEHDSDLVVCDLEYVWETTGRTQIMKGYTEKRGLPIERSIFLAPLFSWNKLYRKKLFTEYEIAFPKGLWYEDIPVVVPIFSLAKNISYVDKVMIHYLQHQSSIMGSKTNPKMFDIFTSMSMVTDFYSRMGTFSTYYAELEYLYIEHFLVYGSFRFLRSGDYKSLIYRAIKTVNSTFPNWRKNSYLKTLSWKYRLYLFILSTQNVEWIRHLIKLKDGLHRG